MIASKDTVSVYIHWPFCLSKCPYCDFNSHVSDEIDHQAFLDAYLSELESYKEYLSGKHVISVFFGGGTPTLARPHVFGKVLERLNEMVSIAPNCEITLEGNPTSIERAKFQDFKAAGINRISIGVQSFDDEELKFLGREHSAKDALKAIELADEIFENYSFDLIYALPNQTLENWQRKLESALQYAKHHISAYQLTIEKGTKFYSMHKKGAVLTPSENIATDLYLLTEEVMEGKGLIAYEVSNYAAVGYECKHNLNYWKYGEFLGIGPGAHGRIVEGDDVYATMNIHDPKSYLAAASSGSPLQSKLKLTDEEIRKERLIMNLRIYDDIGVGFDVDKVNELISHGLLEMQASKLLPTKKGRLLINSIAAFLLD